MNHIHRLLYKISLFSYVLIDGFYMSNEEDLKQPRFGTKKKSGWTNGNVIYVDLELNWDPMEQYRNNVHWDQMHVEVYCTNRSLKYALVV